MRLSMVLQKADINNQMLGTIHLCWWNIFTFLDFVVFLKLKKKKNIYSSFVALLYFMKEVSFLFVQQQRGKNT